MTQRALYVELEAKPGKEQEVESFLSNARAIVDEEPETTAWFAIRMAPDRFGIFDAFPNDHGLEAHLKGQVAAQLMAKAPELFAKTPEIHKLDVIADKLPH
jgi:quinol monooxygenase YgiN